MSVGGRQGSGGQALSGGCQCGAIRFRIEGELGEASICHCRMCQKAMGGPFGAFVSTGKAKLVWTRGDRKRFQSSNQVHRGFCGDCGTPLTFEFGDRLLGLAISAFDEPDAIAPTEQLSPESRVAYVERLSSLPAHASDEPRAAAHLASIVSYQHPDHDTPDWTPRR